MDDEMHRLVRRRFVSGGFALAGACALGIGISAPDAIASKSSKAALLYQDRTNDGKRCADCKFFTPSANDPSTGTCAIVEGTIDRNGWCMAFSAREH